MIELLAGVEPGIELIEITSIGLDPGGNIGIRRLDDLDDVDGADAGFLGQVLTKDTDGQWRPKAPTGGGGGGDPGPLSFLFTQDTPATVWLIDHGLSFNPSGIEVRDHVGQPHYPVASWPSGLSVRLDFDYDVRGTARLS